MITLEDLLEVREQNEKVIAELQAENRVLDKLVNIEKSKQEETEEIAEDNQVDEVNEQSY
jgi:flagellar biosynthesis chaperone FliJ